MSQHKFSMRAALLAGAVTTASLATPAWSQDTGGEDGADAAPVNSIIVTGSRIARPDFTATSPIVSLDSELFEDSASINLEANLNKLPQFSPALTQFNTQEIQPNANTAIGVSTVSLRQLGSNRNLVLIDGRRGMPVNGTGVIDTNSIPSAAVQRVEIITGGASSTYGADAVGGVVNFILKENFTGMSVDFQGGLSEVGDGEEYRISGLVGANLDGGRGNVMLGLERYKRQEIMRSNRDWYQELDGSPLAGGSEFFVSDNYISWNNFTPSNAAYNNLFFPLGASTLLTNVPRGSIYLNQNTATPYMNTSGRTPTVDGVRGTYVPYLVGYTGPSDGTFRKIAADGLLKENNMEQLLSSPQNRWSFFAKGDYEVTPEVNFFAQVTYARTRTKSVSFNTVMTGSFGTLIPYNDDVYMGNAAYRIAPSVDANGNTHADYLAGGRYGLNCPVLGGCTNKDVFPVPEWMATLLDSRGANSDQAWAANITPMAFEKRSSDNRNQTFQMVAGLEGTIPGSDLTWDVTASHGETSVKTDLYGLLSASRFQAILQSPNYGRNFFAVGNEGFGANRNGATGECTTGLSPFLDNRSYSADCNAAARADLQTENRLTQDYVEANLQGGLFELPYGQMRFAVGAHWRRNTMNFHSDNSSTEGSSFFETVNGVFPQASTNGKTTVKEGYGEVFIPLLSNLPFAEMLNLELGYRYSDYNSVGGISTFKANGEWAPTDWLRFRGGYQTASRAPNLGELYTARTQSQSLGLDGDPCSRGNLNSPNFYGNYSANPIGLDSNLNPLASDTTGNPNAAKVEAICRALMGTAGAAEFYQADTVYQTGAGGQYVTSVLTGATELQEETAKSFTIGGVLRSPSNNPWLSRLNLTVDYYNLKLTNGISQLGVDSTYRKCFTEVFNPTFDANNPFCQGIKRDTQTGNPINVVTGFQNVGRVETSGIDAQIDWGVRFADVNIPIPGSFSVNSQFTYLLHFKTTADQVAIPMVDWAGTTGGGEVGTQADSYRWKLFTRFNYNLGAGSLSLQWRHLPSIDHSTSVTNTNGTTVAGAPAYDIFNLSGRYTVNKNLSLRAGIDNLLNTAPPLQAYNTAADPLDGVLPGGRYSAGYYDTIGRRYYIGVGVNF